MVHPFVDLKIGLYFLCKHMDSKMHKSFFRRKNTHFHFVSFCTIIWHDYSSFLRDICKKKLGSKILLGKPVFWPPQTGRGGEEALKCIILPEKSFKTLQILKYFVYFSVLSCLEEKVVGKKILVGLFVFSTRRRIEAAVMSRVRCLSN